MASIGTSRTSSGIDSTVIAAGAPALSAGLLSSSRARPLGYAVVKRNLPSSVLAISASSRARHHSECPCARFPSAKERHPRHLSVNPCFMMSALLMCRRRVFPVASASAIATAELTSSNTTRTFFALLGPSQGLAGTAFRKVRSTFGGLATSNLVHALSLCPRRARHSGQTHQGKFRPPILVRLSPHPS